MGRAADLWEEFRVALEKGDDVAIKGLYASNAVYMEPHNPPHEGPLLIQAYLNSWMQARENLQATVERILESEDGTVVAIEWAISYDAGGRRWNRLPRATWIDVGEGGIVAHRDYY